MLLNPENPLIDFIREHTSVEIPALKLVDVGVSGDIYPIWRKWNNRLFAIGFDASTQEIQRLKETGDDSNIIYESYRVSGNSPHPVAEKKSQSTYNLHRTSAYAAAEIIENMEQQKWWKNPKNGPSEASYSEFSEPGSDPFYKHHSTRMNRGTTPVYTKETITLDEYFAENDERFNFLKIDTDGFELDILHGAKELLDSNWFNFIEVECQFHGPIDSNANIFANIASFLHMQGYSILKIDPYAYSRRALSYPFSTTIAAQSVNGPLQWADVLYYKDPLALTSNQDHQADELLLNALVLDLYGLSDCSAELFVEVKEILPFTEKEWNDCMNFLTGKIRPNHKTYEDFKGSFRKNPFTDIAQ